MFYAAIHVMNSACAPVLFVLLCVCDVCLIINSALGSHFELQQPVKNIQIMFAQVCAKFSDILTILERSPSQNKTKVEKLQSC